VLLDDRIDVEAPDARRYASEMHGDELQIILAVATEGNIRGNIFASFCPSTSYYR
jgi:hypothetical protein